MSHDVLCTLQDSTVLVCSGFVVNGSVVSVLISDVGVEYRYGEVVWKPGSLHGVPWRARVETWQLPRSPMDSAVWIWLTSRQLATDAVVCNVSQCHDSWQRMQWYATSLSVSTAGNGNSGTPWTLDQVKYLFLSMDD